MNADDDSESVVWANDTAKQKPKKQSAKQKKKNRKRRVADNEDLDNPDIRAAIEAFGDLDALEVDDDDDDDDDGSDEELHKSIPASSVSASGIEKPQIDVDDPKFERPIKIARRIMDENSEENRKQEAARKEEEDAAAADVEQDDEIKDDEEDDEEEEDEDENNSMEQSAVNSIEQQKRDAKFLKDEAEKAGEGKSKKKSKDGKEKGIIPTVPSADAPLPESHNAPLPEEVFFTDEEGWHEVTRLANDACCNQPPPKKKRKSAFRIKFTGDTIVTEFARKALLLRDNNTKFNADSLTPKSEPELLLRLSNQRLREEKLDVSTKCRAISHECELIALSGEMRASTNVNDLRRALRFYDDFALEKRVTDYGQTTYFDKAHQLSLFIARMKIINALYNVLLPKFQHDGIDVGEDRYLQNEYWREADVISDVELARWMYKNNTSSLRMLVLRQHAVTNEVTVLGHLIHKCTLDCFWRSIQALMAAWPRLKFSGYLVRYFNELRRRCAFFVSYCENLRANPSGSMVKENYDRNESLILGLNASLFAYMNFTNEDDRPATTDSTIFAINRHERKANNNNNKNDDDDDSPLIDNLSLAKINDDGTAHITMDFIDECERIFHYIQEALRQAAGFRRSPLDFALDMRSVESSATPYVDESFLSIAQQKRLNEHAQRCSMCRRETRAHITQAHIDRLESLVDRVLRSEFSGFITEIFRERIFTLYEEPSELEEYREFHRQEVLTALNCISQQRPSDFRVLSTRYLNPQITDVWAKLKGDFDEPAYAFLVGLAINFHLQQHFKGGQIASYVVSSQGLKPFLFSAERCGQHRLLASDVYVPDKTCGTLYYRNKLLIRDGRRDTSPLEREYAHPVMLRVLNSHFVLFGGHTHRVRSFAHSFLHWLELVCQDKAIGGQIPTGGGLLFDLYAEMFPEKGEEITAQRNLTLAKLRKYNPAFKMFDGDELNSSDDDEGIADDESRSKRKARKNPLMHQMKQF